MGVNGLWTVIQPCARPTNLATLNRKRLAVDASIWIYQFLKAVRDKEGNALRNSHVVGFFRRICKLLWFGIQPVFVFDGGAPTLKRQTIMGRKRRREGRREDAVRTAGKLLAVQMQRIAEEEGEKRKRRMEQEKEGLYRPEVEEPIEELPSADKLVYVDELGMNQQERQKSRRFFKQDAYHLPELDSGLAGMGRPEDPRIMSVEELEEYARQFQSGEDINLYDFSKIDFDGEFFKSLPPADRYNILNAARLRSRLRMGLSKEQLDEMFPDRMAFSKFQIERVKERNHLTQRLMQEAGMTGLDLTLGKNSRIAGEKDREYILVKNDGAEGGWALGVVSKEKDVGEIHKPIDVDALEFHYQEKEEAEWEDEDDFEDVPIEGLNRLPKISSQADREVTGLHQPLNNSRAPVAHGRGAMVDDEDDSLFVQGPSDTMDDLFDSREGDNLEQDEEEDVSRAIALSLRNQHGLGSSANEEEDADEDFEDVPAPEWTQKPAEQPKPVTSASGSMIAHIVNNRANAAVPKRRRSNASSDGEADMRTALSAARKKRKPAPPNPVFVPTVPNKKNPFAGPLPFEKLDWKSSIFAKKPLNQTAKDVPENGGGFELEPEDDVGGGFEVDEGDAQDDMEAPRPLPPWMVQNQADIRDSVKSQEERVRELNEEDREAALEEQKRRRKEAIIQIDSSDDDSDVELVDAPPPKSPNAEILSQHNHLPPATLAKVNPPAPNNDALQGDELLVNVTDGIVETTALLEPQDLDAGLPQRQRTQSAPTPEPDFEDVEALQPQPNNLQSDVSVSKSPKPVSIDMSAVPQEVDASTKVSINEDGELVVQEGQDGIDDEFSDPEDEELLAQMAEEAEEHARFASQLNNKSERENQDAYERELKALRTQQKKDRRDADEVTQIMITECQALLRLFGIPYITAPMEAEAQCAELVRLGLVDGIVTDDSDTFLFGGTRVYKNMFNSNKFVECYLGTDLEKELSLSREQLISLAQLLGSDYTEGLPGVGPVTAVEILSEFPGRDGLEAFRDWWQDVQIHNRPKDADATSTFRKKFRKSQGTKLFLPIGFPNPLVFEAYNKPEVDHSADQFKWGVPDVDGLRRFLMATIGWTQERTDEVLVPVIRDMHRREAEGTQSNITRYFEGSVGVGAKEAFAPRQRGQTSKRMADAVNKLRAKAGSDNLAVPVVDSEASTTTSSRPKRNARNRAVVDDDDDGDDVQDGSDGNDEDNVQAPTRKRGKGKGKAKANGKKAKVST